MERSENLMQWMNHHTSANAGAKDPAGRTSHPASESGAMLAVLRRQCLSLPLAGDSRDAV